MARVRYARTADGIDIAYAVTGDGPPLLVARPLLRAAVDDELEYQFDAGLPRLAETRSVIIWDYRGSGLSMSTEPEYTLESSLLDMTAVADALELTRVDVLAQLTPCQTAIAFAARNPDRVHRLVLRNPSEPGGSPRTSTLVDLPDIAHSHFKEYIQLAALRIMGWEYAAAARRWETLMLRQFNRDTWARLMDSMERVDAMAEVPSVQAPTLVILDTTAWDRQTSYPPARQQFIRYLAASLPHGELISLKTSDPAAYAEQVEEFLGGERHAPRPARAAGSATAIILFVDIADSTALTERMGDAAFRQGARSLDQALRRIITGHGGTAIDGKLVGDGVLATFPSASQAIEAALDCGNAASANDLQLHLGVHAGDIIREENNVYGGAVNIASRISALCAPGDVLVSDVVRALARTSAGVTFEDRGEHLLKGVGEPQRVYAVRKGGSG